MKSTWEPLNVQCSGLLGASVTDEKSISKMVKFLGFSLGRIPLVLLLESPEFGAKEKTKWKRKFRVSRTDAIIN